mmetsp:Transcript_55502/g.141106  ORF Transcript_55502/g.141106 Transcript_55502/m.141106 type:complete len:214 (-) Transcript_55502:1278-1919(-)
MLNAAVVKHEIHCKEFESRYARRVEGTLKIWNHASPPAGQAASHLPRAAHTLHMREPSKGGGRMDRRVPMQQLCSHLLPSAATRYPRGLGSATQPPRARARRAAAATAAAAHQRPKSLRSPDQHWHGRPATCISRRATVSSMFALTFSMEFGSTSKRVGACCTAPNAGGIVGGRPIACFTTSPNLAGCAVPRTTMAWFGICGHLNEFRSSSTA